jgi:hypothetical protein
MSNANFNAIKEHVDVQYGDMTGVIQIDGHDNVSSIYRLCEDNGFKTERIFIIGLGLGEDSIQGIGEGGLLCSVLFVNKDDYGTSYEEIKSKIKLGSQLVLQKKSFYINYKDLGKYIKRFDMLVTTGLTDGVSSIEVVEAEE